MGISIAAGVRVGNALGAGNPEAVRRTIKVALVLIGNYVILSQQKYKDQLTTEAWPNSSFGDKKVLLDQMQLSVCENSLLSISSSKT